MKAFRRRACEAAEGQYWHAHEMLGNMTPGPGVFDRSHIPRDWCAGSVQASSTLCDTRSRLRLPGRGFTTTLGEQLCAVVRHVHQWKPHLRPGDCAHRRGLAIEPGGEVERRHVLVRRRHVINAVRGRQHVPRADQGAGAPFVFASAGSSRSFQLTCVKALLTVMGGVC